MSEVEAHVAENQTSKEGSIVVVHHESAQCYFRPETEELVFIAGDEATAFENHWRDMAFTMDEFHQANANYSRVLENYAQAAIADAMAAVAQIREVDAAEKELEDKRKKIQDKLADLSHKGLGYKDVVELIPVGGQGAKNKGGGKSPRLAYVNKGYFSQAKDGLKLHTISLNADEKKGTAQSIYSKDKNGNTLIDTDKLTKKLMTLKRPKIKLDLKDALKWAGMDEALKNLKEDYVLYDWAESWNNSLHGEKEGFIFSNLDVSGAAQFMRFASNAGGSAEFDVEKRQLSIKGEYKRTLTVASGVANLTLYVPDRTGWGLKMKVADMGTVDLGLLRLCLDVQASGFVGGSLQLEAQLQVMMQGDQQMIAGQPGGRLPRFSQRKNDVEFYQTMKKEEEGLQATAEFFRGGRVEVALKGSLQWMKPTPPPGDPAAPTGILKSSGQFTDFCSIGGNIGGMVGIGAGGKFHCTFINGKFCFHIAASLCWGYGAKGGLIAEVGAANIVEFGAWLVYQLYSLDYGFFEIVDEQTFKAYSLYCVMAMDKVGEKIYAGFDKALKTPEDVAGRFERFMKDIESEAKKGMEASKGRNRLAKNIIEFKRDLLQHTPEAKGILLYLLTCHGKLDHIDPDNRSLLGDIYRERKEAVICVLTSVQTVAEWNKVMCRITVDGSSLRGDESEAQVVEQQVQHLVHFLQEGYNRDQDLHDIYKRLKKNIAFGYALDMNDTLFYRLHDLPNPHFPRRCEFGPCGTDSAQFV
ncbi:MAG TPA: hypothetical protein VGC62_20630 [Pseudomonas sp.]|uniref:hypothetical protein n=1 Tax=Pseudomonas sp. TaxID=306 RepID=UPI002ED909BE